MKKFSFGIYSLSIIKHLDISSNIDDVDLNACAIVADLKTILTGDLYAPEVSIIICQVEESHEKNLNKLIELYKDQNIPQLKALPSLFFS